MAKYEGSPADRLADKKNAAKAGMSVKRWEGSKADEKKDAEARRKMAAKGKR